MEILLAYPPPPLVKEAWGLIQGWYNMASNHPPNPSRITLAQITEDRVELYRKVNPPRYNIHIEMPLLIPMTTSPL